MSRILIVEPNATQRRLVQFLLVSAGFRVMGVTSVAAARAQLAQGSVVLAFCEVELPDGSGLDLIADLRAAGTNHVVMLSTQTRPQDRELAIGAGADELVGKPISPAAVLAIADAFADSAHVEAAMSVVGAS